uniref:DNA topoisomerase (ATP-hydrolyzing) n=1 Tax=viral metagenome TaxID=1070528 RepID=A0A6C0CT18_9ZZZZ
MAKDIQEKYKKHELRDHIYQLPDTYIGSVERTILKTWLYDPINKRMIEKEIEYVPGLYKIYDEILVNAIDQSSRLKAEVKAGKKDVKPLKQIHIDIDRKTGIIEVINDGDGIDIEKHASYNNVWIPELIFGELLTSTNYDPEQEKLWGGKNGYGAKLANIFSDEFIIETVDHRRSLIYKQRFYENMKKRETAKVKTSTKSPYTKIRFLPDYARFGLDGLTDDLYDLFRKRAYDACATTDSTVSVYFNDEKLEAKDFEKYADLYIGNKDERPRAYESCSDRWEVIATYSESGQFEQISFVNGINTLRGGKHVEYLTNQITKKLSEMASSKKKKEVKPQHIKDNLTIIVKAYIVNPAFDSQTKETLTTQASKFGSKCDLSDKFFDKLYKTGIVEKAVSLTEFHEKKKVAKTDGKKTARVLIPKLDDANRAGTKDSINCTLILTEGDSAKTMAIAGLSVIGRDYYGVFPLRGKILNVKDANLKKIAENEEITNLKKIIGLEQGKDYKDLSSLRYGRIMIMTDQDHDGSHIKGLLFNVFQSIWPSLYKTERFLTSMLTPIIKVTHTNGEKISFYSITDFENWRKATEKTAIGLRPWTIKYYKGLGTSTANEAKDYFRDMKVTEYVYTGKTSDENLDLAFNKKRADDRKSWLMKYNRETILDYSQMKIPYEEFVNKDLIHFSNRDLERSIPSLCDGLKESTRKIMYGCFKRRLFNKEIKVAQLSGYISEVSAYHHGETSLQQAIIGMAQNFVGTNNIHLMQPIGQFGTRIQGGSDSASARYIHTLLTEMARKIFRQEDNPILNRMEDDGKPIEPEYYIPILPLVLVNGGIGIGTGFSTNIPQHNPSDVIDQCMKIIEALNKQEPIQTKEDIESMYKVIDKTRLGSIQPWYLGFKGTITPGKEGTYQSRGVWKWLDDQILEITELPIGTWTEDYKEYLIAMIANNSPILKDFENHYTDKNVRFILKFYPGVRPGVELNLETEFKLVSSKNLSMNNIHLYSEAGSVQKYKDTQEIIKEWSKVRLLKYYERKKYQLKELDNKYKLVSSKVRFIQEIIDKQLHIMNRMEKEVEAELTERGYPKLVERIQADDEDETPEQVAKQVANYDYLINMPIRQLTFEKKQELEKEAQRLDMMIKELKTKTIQQIWKEELEDLESIWETYRKEMEYQYENDAPMKEIKLKKKK